ncbi:hypothetical protein [Cytobacillus sp. IB215665]|uniref:hypothetical protein n=1 Tax=Cytobacillus sp. IB215665 TaxID=3097357 RepID=UPI002A1651F1|nr:hypothetical protein [Cytobacillus sp. IB215665]MDX8367813.1 hypothetical protein [Cytobacillus sp. IB215665]
MVMTKEKASEIAKKLKQHQDKYFLVQDLEEEKPLKMTKKEAEEEAKKILAVAEKWGLPKRKKKKKVKK